MKVYIYVFLMLMAIVGCREKTDMNYIIDKDMKSINYEAVEDLKDKKIFFGHASVGYNIINGIEDIVANNNRFQNINIRELKDPEVLDRPGIYHAKNGKNSFPESKVNAFKNRLIKNSFGSKLDIAFFKFCYIDINRDSDVREIFNYYVETIENLKKKFSKLTIMHVTTPLNAHARGIKGFIKNLIRGDISNVKRNQFNTLLIKKYQGIDPIYDLAKIESMYPDGGRSYFKHNGKKYYSLAKQYTYDGGHLNEIGRYLAAKELLRVLSEPSKNNKY